MGLSSAYLRLILGSCAALLKLKRIMNEELRIQKPPLFPLQEHPTKHALREPYQGWAC